MYFFFLLVLFFFFSESEFISLATQQIPPLGGISVCVWPYFHDSFALRFPLSTMNDIPGL